MARRYGCFGWFCLVGKASRLTSPQQLPGIGGRSNVEDLDLSLSSLIA